MSIAVTQNEKKVAIEMRGITKAFGTKVVANKNVDLTVYKGEILAILGANGCGKTTLFKILTGEMDYDDGEVYVDPNKRIGLISQIPRFPDGWTTEDVLKSAHQHLYNIQELLHIKIEETSHSFTVDEG